MSQKGANFQSTDLQKILIKIFPDRTNSNRPKIKRLLTDMENDGLIKITDRADISFQNDNFQVDFKWDDIHVKAIMTQKGIDKIHNYKNVGFEKQCQ